jgi:hypothetical protein
MIKIEPQHYIKGMHNLLNAHFILRNDKRFHVDLKRFQAFYESKEGNATMNNHVQSFVYLYLAKINKHFLEGTFSEGLELVSEIESKLKEFELQLDRHRTLVFYYKIACLYFGSGDFNNTVVYLNKIIHWKSDLRSDLQCYARLLHLISHYELGNEAILESLIRSVFRFMSNMQNLGRVEKEIFTFLRNSFRLHPNMLKSEFSNLLSVLTPVHENSSESRSFMYLDILSWLESKLNDVPVQTIVREKFISRNNS